MLENVDIDYENSLKSIYNIITEEDGPDFENNPFFKAMKIPGQINLEDTTETDRTTEQPREETDQGG